LTPQYEGAGAVVTLFIGLFMVHRPLGRYVSGLGMVRWLLTKDTPEGKDARARRWIVRLGLIALVVIVLLLPYPYETGGAFNILADRRSDVPVEIDGGRVVKVFVREGEMVKASQPLGQIDPRQYERNVELTQAQLDETEAKLRLLRKELALLKNPPNIESIEALGAEVRRLEALLADYKRQLDLTTLRAPIAGRVTTPLIEQSVGKYLKQGDLFAAVEQAQSVQIEIHVPEADAPQVKIGARVKVVPWAYPYETFSGTVKDIAPIALPPGSTVTAKSVRVVAEIPNPDARLKSQLTGYAKIKTDSIPVWRVFSRLIARWFAVQVWYWLP
jgi:multidrug efflux pump subunit AcrA (membrane-fusion protein)